MTHSLVLTKKQFRLAAAYALAATLAATTVGCSMKESAATPAVRSTP
jgi:hypothetical protein